jgi:inosose dehydratase/3D-(3,5/4)-trihydroxycyclohexane-1,2-dione acylhydrolase (decyclizing)
MTVRLGTNPIGWSNDDLRELGGETPLETCLSEARSAGFDGIELGHKFPRDAAILAQVLDRHGLALVSGWYSSRLLERDAAAELNAMRPHLTLLRELGCTVLILAETSNAIHGDRAAPLSSRPVLTDDQWPLFARRLNELADAVRGEGLWLAYHHHMGTIVQSAAEIDRMMDMTGPNLTLLLDTGHATFAGADPIALARRHRARISHVHCKDVRADVMDAARRNDRSFLDSVVDGVFTVPGDGMVDFPGVLAELKFYTGWLVVEAEQDPARAHPLTYARLGHANLAGFAARAGLL